MKSGQVNEKTKKSIGFTLCCAKGIQKTIGKVKKLKKNQVQKNTHKTIEKAAISFGGQASGKFAVRSRRCSS